MIESTVNVEQTDAQEAGRIVYVLRWISVPVRRFWTDEEAINSICRETLVKGTPQHEDLLDYFAFCRYRQRAYRGRIRWNERREEVQIQRRVYIGDEGSYVYICDTQSPRDCLGERSEVD